MVEVYGSTALRGYQKSSSRLLRCCFSISEFIKILKWKFLRLIFLMTYYSNLNSCVKGVEILANAISVPITNLNYIFIVIKNFAFALTIYCWSNKSIALIKLTSSPTGMVDGSTFHELNDFIVAAACFSSAGHSVNKCIKSSL